MIEILEESARFQTIKQRFADHVRTIIKKVWFSYLKILEIHQQKNKESSQQDPNSIINTQNTEKQKKL